MTHRANPRRLAAALAWRLFAGALGAFAFATVAAAQGAPVGVAFAKASPLVLYDSPALENGVPTGMSFGEAYPVSELLPNAVHVELPGGASGYLRLGHVLYQTSPSWVRGSSAYNSDGRAFIQFWESSQRLTEYLGGVGGEAATHSYREHFEDPPAFPLRLPVFAIDTLELLGGRNQRTIAAVLVPFTRDEVTAFAATVAEAQPGAAPVFLLDVSGSTRGYLERLVASTAAILGSRGSREGFDETRIFVFGEGVSDDARFAGTTSLARLPDLLSALTERRALPAAGGTGVEPLPQAVELVFEALRSEDADIALIVLSGADVDLTGLDRLARDPLAASPMIFAQATPEPGPALERAARSFPEATFVSFSAGLAARLAASIEEIPRIGGRPDLLGDGAMGPVVEAAHASRLMAVLPRVLTAEQTLPPAPSFAPEADWYTAQLWLTIDGVLLSIAHE